MCCMAEETWPSESTPPMLWMRQSIFGNNYLQYMQAALVYEKLKDTASLVRLYVEGHHWDEVSTLSVCLCVYRNLLYACLKSFVQY